MIKRIKTDVIKFMADREKDDNYLKFINWKRRDNEIVVLTMYAYDDILLPKKYDIVFEIEKPDNFVNCNFTIMQAIFNGWTPLNQISNGHKHICILQFDKEICNIFSSLTSFDNREKQQNNFQLGFCDSNDFEAIRNKLQTRS